MSIREKRLAQDYEAIRQLTRQSGGTIMIRRSTPMPPDEYVLAFRCPGVTGLTGDTPVIMARHEVEITLPYGYPRHEPVVSLRTPLFHPNVFPNGRVCLGRQWMLTEPLSELVLRIGKVIQGDPGILNLASPANRLAARWYEAHQASLPIGSVAFNGAAPHAEAILAWQEQAEVIPASTRDTVAWREI